MLPAAHRLRRPADFTAVLRTGSRVRRGCLVVHFLAQPDSVVPSRVGLIVGKTVGGSVVRHQVSRRLRAQLAGRLDLLPDGSATVVRALPEAATTRSAQLARDLDAALERLARVRSSAATQAGGRR
ncbi:MAG: ribonuclease P protein component [Actinobacteria bacterium]|nr:ribonuclease P protein component [Actinomycetota bacterium]